jgi:hypothetical protein
MTPRAAIITAFAAILSLVVAVDVYARRPESGLQPLSVTLAALLRSRGGRIVVFAAWLWLGWHFLAR